MAGPVLPHHSLDSGALTNTGVGLGTMMAQALAANGAAKVYILGRRLEKLEEVAKTGVRLFKLPALSYKKHPSA